jgi:hypothetical protein
MKRIQKFNEFVNEGYLERIGQKISSWYNSVKDAIKKGLVRIIPSGPKKGLPSVSVFGPEGGSILDQVNKFYQGSEYSKMNNIMDPSTVTEAVVPMKFPISDDIPDSSVDEIKADIKRNLKALLKGVDAGNEKVAFTIKPIFIYGAPGIGKTQIVAQVCDEVGNELYGEPLNLLNVDGETSEPVDFAGVPKVIDVAAPGEEGLPYGKGVTRSNINIDLLPLDNGKNGNGGIIFIDEMNRMPEQVIKIFMKLAQGRRVGQLYQIPSKWYIVAAGNRKEDDPRNVKELGTALRDRFDVVNYVATPQSYRKYIESSDLSNVVMPELLDFLEFQSEFFHSLDPASKKTKYPTPRAWTDASYGVKRLIDEFKEMGIDKVPDSTLIREFSKSVGKDSASAFVSYYKVAKSIPIKDLEMPFTNPEKAPIPADRKSKDGKIDVDYRIALFNSVLKKSEGKTLTANEVCNYTKWLIRTNDNEFGPACLTMLFKLHPYLRQDAQAIACISPLAQKWEADIGVDF